MAGRQGEMKDERRDVDVLLSDEKKMLIRGARMMHCSERGVCACLNEVAIPEIKENPYISKREALSICVARERGYNI